MVELLEAADVDEVLTSAPGEMAGRFEITHEDGTPVSGDSFPGRRLVRGEDATPLLMRMVHRVSGRERWVLVKATLLDEEGPFALNVIADVTATRRP
jgi:hypothetical protein